MIKELIEKYKRDIEERKEIDKIVDIYQEKEDKVYKAKKELEQAIDEYYTQEEIYNKKIQDIEPKVLEKLKQNINDIKQKVDTAIYYANEYYKKEEENILKYNKFFDKSADGWFYQKHLIDTSAYEYMNKYILNNYLKK